jgi:hypothetical protein
MKGQVMGRGVLEVGRSMVNLIAFLGLRDLIGVTMNQFASVQQLDREQSSGEVMSLHDCPHHWLTARDGKWVYRAQLIPSSGGS